MAAGVEAALLTRTGREYNPAGGAGSQAYREVATKLVARVS